MAVQSAGGANLPATFFDQGSYTPMFGSESGPTCAAFGYVGGQGAYAVWQNGDALSAADVEVCTKTLQLAAKTGSPVVTFYNSKGALLEEGNKSLAAVSALAEAASQVSGVVPQIAVVTGVCGASSALAAASADFVILSKEADFFLTAPFISAAKGDKTPGAGSADAAVKAGIAALVADDAEIAAQQAAKLCALVPSNNLASPAGFSFTPPIGLLDSSKYSAHSALAAVADEESLFELYTGFGENVVVAFCTVSGNVAGVVATEGESSTLGKDDVAKISRFVRFCDAYSLPVVTLANCGGFEESTNADIAGNLREAARLTATYADATTAKLLAVTGKAVGPLFTALASADLTIAMQGCTIAPAEPSAVASVLFHTEIEESGNNIEAETAARAKSWAAENASAEAAQKEGLADFVADAGSLRATIASALDILATKRTQRLPKKHGNMPL